MSVTFSTFNPELIPWQDTVVDEIHTLFDYRSTHHEVLLSGAVGSAKTTLVAHEIVKHCLMFPKAHVMIGRRSLPDLKGTLYKAVLDQLDQDDLSSHFKANDTRAIIKFSNGSLIRGLSWADRRYKKIRSYEFSMVAIEEATENDEEDYNLYKEAIMRLRHQVDIDAYELELDEEDPCFDEEIGDLSLRPDISKGAPRIMLVATNPDSPAHWLYRHFITSTEPNRHVYYSLTADNPFLPPGYLEDQKKSLDPKMARRMLYGEWLDIRSEVIYHAYEPDVHYLKDQSYKINLALPIRITFDFNIGVGKPMSCALAQYDPVMDMYHGFNEAVIEGARTEDIMEDLKARGLLDHDAIYYIHGDRNGNNRSTQSRNSDFELIESFLSNVKNSKGRPIRYEMHVASSNPPVRDRHNLVNSYFKNEMKQVRTRIYKDAPTLNQGFLLTALKKGGNYIEDDSTTYQHITTAWGYMVCYEEMFKGFGPVRSY